MTIQVDVRSYEYQVHGGTMEECHEAARRVAEHHSYMEIVETREETGDDGVNFVIYKLVNYPRMLEAVEVNEALRQDLR